MKNNSILINKSKKVIPSGCQIADTFFSHMNIIGDLKENEAYLSKHMDKENFETALFYVGDLSNGGDSKYYTGLTNKSFGHLTRDISCQHGRSTIGQCDKTLHCGESWSGIRGCINLNLKKKVMEYFSRYGNKYFSSGPFFSC